MRVRHVEINTEQAGCLIAALSPGRARSQSGRMWVSLVSGVVQDAQQKAEESFSSALFPETGDSNSPPAVGL